MQQTPPIYDDMIDFSVYIKKIMYPFTLFLANWKTVIAYSIVSVFLSVLVYFILPPQYSASFIIKPNDKTDMYYLSMLLDIQNLAKDRDNTSISKLLNITNEEAKSLKKMTFQSIAENNKSDANEAVLIHLFLDNRDLFPIVQNNIILYIENSPHYVKKNVLRKASIDSLKQKLIDEMIEIDSVKKLVVNTIKPSISNGNGLVYNVPLDPFKAYEVNMARYKEQLDLIEQENFTNSFDIIKECVASKKPVSPKLLSILVVFFPLAIILCFIHLHRKNNVSKV